MKDKKMFAKAKPVFLVTLIMMCFIFSRGLFLDRDISAPPNLAIYSPYDELYYTMPAFDLFHYGELNHGVVSYISGNVTPLSLAQNYLTFFTLKLFGNNYYGLRTASLVSAFLVFALLIYVLKRTVGQSEHAQVKLILLCASFFLLSDYSFLMAGRVADPTIFRMLAMMIIIWVISTKPYRNEQLTWFKSGLLGILATGSMLYFYPHNFFIIVACGFFVILTNYSLGWRKLFPLLFSFLMGILITIGSYEIILEKVYNTNLIKLYSDIFLSFGSRNHLNLSARNFIIYLVTNFVKNLTVIFSTNIFRFNPLLLVMFLLSLPIYFFKTVKERDRFNIFISSLLLFLLMQSFVANDFPYRKLIMFLPLVIVTITNALLYIKQFVNYLNTRNWLRNVYMGYFIIVILFVVKVYLTVIDQIDLKNETILIALNVAVMVIMLTLILIHRYIRLNKNALIVFAFFLMMIPNLFLCIKYVYSNPTFNYRNAMIAIADKVDGKVITGRGFAMRLYNTSIPVLNFYQYKYRSDTASEYNILFRRLYKEKIASYSFGFDKDIDKRFMKNENMKLIKSLDLKVPMRYKMEMYAPNENEDSF